MYADEVCDVYNVRLIRKSRVTHKCDACSETIPIGSSYTKVTKIFDGIVERIRRCVRCELIYEHLRGLPRDYDEFIDDRLACGHTYEERHGCPPPEDVASLAFALPDDFKGGSYGPER